MAIIELPLQNLIDRSSGPTSEGFAISEVRYSANISQRSFKGPDVSTSREEVWKINWAFLNYATPEEVAKGEVDQLLLVRKFYQDAQLGQVRWKPFEIAQTRIWQIIPNSLKVSNIAGCVFKASLDLKYLYDE